MFSGTWDSGIGPFEIPSIGSYLHSIDALNLALTPAPVCLSVGDVDCAKNVQDRPTVCTKSSRNAGQYFG